MSPIEQLALEQDYAYHMATPFEMYKSILIKPQVNIYSMKLIQHFVRRLNVCVVVISIAISDQNKYI